MMWDRLLPARLRRLGPEALKFAIVGAGNTLVNFLVLNGLVLTVFPNGELKAKVVATVVAMITSYLMNRHWTYKDRPKDGVTREFVMFVIFNVAGLAIELAIMGATKYALGLTSLLALNVAAFFGLVLGTVFRFFTYRVFVFAPANTVAVGPAGADVDLGPAHLHVADVEELLDAEAIAATAAGVPVPAQVHRDDFTRLTASLEAEFAAEAERLAALDAELSDAQLSDELTQAKPRPER
ncbi:GtrA family protein [Catellatospora sp. KI3]|uniref:GtrA family protein n=1 Tax=Catellatospora sp. KI3 TaxID=3041620 RepID=UPI0024830771|nr:GtrA family protein [Catellatospora sp. KI3]MDI1459913.1 GtrA family protein [Catellatospora sp. KI3]